MKYPDKEFERFIKAFSPYSEEDLLNEKLKHPRESAPYRAAEILLDKKRHKRERTILMVAILTLLFAAATFIFDAFLKKEDKPQTAAPSIQTEQQGKERSKPDQNPLSPSGTTAQQVQQNKKKTK